MAEEKPELGDRLMKAVRLIIASNGVSYLQMTSVGSHSASEREKEGKNNSKKQVNVYCLRSLQI